MKRIAACAVCIGVLISSLYCALIFNVSAAAQKNLYTDFSNALIADTPVLSGNGDNTISLYSGFTVSNFVQKDEALSITVENGNYIRFANTLAVRSLGDKYMVIRMKGTNSWGDGLTGNALKFWFGSWGNPGAGLYMTAQQLTADYSDVVIEIPAGYFDELTSDDLFITSERGAVFDITIDEIYFCSKYPLEEETPEPAFEKSIYADFEQPLQLNTPVCSNSADGTITLFHTELCTQSVENGALNLTFDNPDSYIRFTNSLALTDATKTAKFKYMVLRMKGTAVSNSGGEYTSGPLLRFIMGNWGNEGNPVVMDASLLSADEYTTVVLELSDRHFAGTAAGYESGLIIRNAGSADIEFSIDEIYFCDTDPSLEEEPTEPSAENYIYSDFSNELSLGNPVVSDGADGTITLFYSEGLTHTVSDGALHLKYTDELGYIRFTNSLVLTDDCKTSKYKYLVMKIKGTASKSSGEALTSGTALNLIMGNWGNEANPVTFDASLLDANEYKTVALELSDRHFAGTAIDYITGLIIRSAGNYAMEIDIDEIYFTDTKPADDSDYSDDEEDISPPEEAPEEESSSVYSDFTEPLSQGAPVDNGAGGTITLFGSESCTQSVSDGALNLALNGGSAYIRFTSSLALTDDCATAKYRYMVIDIKGSAQRSDGSAVTGNLLNVIFGSWGNEMNPVVISGSQIKNDEYTTLVFELEDRLFAATHADYASGLILRNAGNFNSSLVIDKISFTDTKPEIPSAPVTPPPSAEEKVNNYYSDFSTPLTEGAPVDNGDGGTITLFNTVDCTQSVSSGALNLKLKGEGSYARFTSSLELTKDLKNPRFKYMVIKIKGSVTSVTGAEVNGNALKVIMGSWGNEANPLIISSSQITDSYSTLVFELKAQHFSSTHADYASGLIIQSAGNYNIDVLIDEIYFTDTKPQGTLASVNQGNQNSFGGSAGGNEDSAVTPPDNGEDTPEEKPVSGTVNEGDDNGAKANESADAGIPVAGIILLALLAAILIAFGAVSSAITVRLRRLSV